MPATGRDGLSDEAGGTRHIRPHLCTLAGTTHARATRADSFTGPRFHRRAGVGGACSSGNPNRSECHRGRPETGRHLHPRNRQRLDALRQALNSADTQRATREAHTRTSSSACFIRASCAMPRNGSNSDPKADGSPRPNLNRRRSKRRTRACAPNYGKARLNLRQDIFVTVKFLLAICPVYSRTKNAHGRWHGDCRNPVRG